MDILNKKTLITGGAIRVGRQIALTLAKKGSDILLHYGKSASEAEKTADEVRALGRKCELFSADLSKTQDIARMIDGIHTKVGAIDCLVNSASLFYKTPIDSVKESDFDMLIDVNLKAPFLLSVELGKKMAAGKGGKIINIADWSGFRPYKNYAPYCASKGGLITLTKSLARDLAPKVFVNAIAPGPVMAPANMTDEEKETVAKQTILGRWGGAEDIANAAAFLLENDFINGTVLVVDGGRSLV